MSRQAQAAKAPQQPRQSRWGPGSGLKIHHCPVCEKPLAREEAKTQCLGPHVEPCRRFHGMSRLGHGSNCKTCLNIDEQHWKRHRKIAELMNQLRSLLAKSSEDTMTSSIPGEEIPSEAWNVLKLSKKERKAVRSLIRSQDRERIVTEADITAVAEALHPGSEGTTDTGQPDENIHEICPTPKSRRVSAMSANEDYSSDIDAAELTRILAALDVELKPTSTTDPEIAKLITKLSKAISADLVQHHIDLRTEAKDRQDFFTWATATAYRTFMDNGQKWELKANDRKRVDSFGSNPASGLGKDISRGGIGAGREVNGLKDLLENSGKTHAGDDALSSSSASSSSGDSSYHTAASTVSDDSSVAEEWKVVAPKKHSMPRTTTTSPQAPMSPVHRKQNAGKLIFKFAHNNGLHHLAPKGKYAHLKEAKCVKNAWTSKLKFVD